MNKGGCVVWRVSFVLPCASSSVASQCFCVGSETVAISLCCELCICAVLGILLSWGAQRLGAILGVFVVFFLITVL